MATQGKLLKEYMAAAPRTDKEVTARDDITMFSNKLLPGELAARLTALGVEGVNKEAVKSWINDEAAIPETVKPKHLKQALNLTGEQLVALTTAADDLQKELRPAGGVHVIDIDKEELRVATLDALKELEIQPSPPAGSLRGGAAEKERQTKVRNAVGFRLKGVRESMGLKPSEFAVQAGIETPTYLRLEANSDRLTHAEYEAILKVAQGSASQEALSKFTDAVAAATAEGLGLIEERKSIVAIRRRQ